MYCLSSFLHCVSYIPDLSSFLAGGMDISNITNHATFTSVRFNEGNDYNLTTGEFTCRVPGTYLFSATIYKNYHATEAYCHFHLNSSWIMMMRATAGRSEYHTASASVVFTLNAGDRVYISTCTDISTFYSTYSFFTGVLISKT